MAAHAMEQIRQLTYAIASDMTMHIHTGSIGTAYTSNRVTGDPTVTISAGEWDAIDETATEVTYGSIESFGDLSTSVSITVTKWTLFRGSDPAYEGTFTSPIVVAANVPFQLNADMLILDVDSL